MGKKHCVKFVAFKRIQVEIIERKTQGKWTVSDAANVVVG